MTTTRARDALGATPNNRPVPRTWHRPALLLLGTVAQLFAVGGRWDIAAAAWIFPVLLLRFARTGRAWSGALWVWVAHFAAAVFWLFESKMGFSPLTLTGAAGLAALLALPFLLDRLLLGRVRPWMSLLAFPAALAGAEFLITLLSPFGTAYGALAVTQYGDLPLLQVLAVTGAYGIGFLIAWVAAVVNRVWETASWRAARSAVVTCAAVLLAVHLGGGARLAFAPDRARTVRIAGVTADRSVIEAQKAAFARAAGAGRDIAAAAASSLRPAMTAVRNSLLAATRREATAGAKIVVWPEEAVRTTAADEHATLAAARDQARRSRIYLEIGVRVYGTAGPRSDRDETALIDPHGTVRWTYQKAHPIPGSEPFAPGDGKVPVVDTPYGRIANVICYDADFPAMMRAGADIMLVPAHDWREYGGAHTQKAALRGIESGYAVVRQDAEGVSAAFDHQGHVLATADYFTTGRQTMVAQVPVRGVGTPYDVIGDAFAWLCLAAAGAVAVAGVTGVAHPRPPRRP
ncbi:nitrilase-related carbon-nitrogen hydrolase [Streptomyces gilvosporeus]|uniref:Nitrilase n=1 Tax=Streptomyces gilvosporeus TaxID=553510 RepID=A0A1V0TTS8_9ACTN|nr:nitrilase-related carbon-nitrogen hydrolase [Streptomyces gilvosporeus]ARF56250.1 nitrilase [Streptomyces gilvosporeus]